MRTTSAALGCAEGTAAAGVAAPANAGSSKASPSATTQYGYDATWAQERGSWDMSVILRVLVVCGLSLGVGCARQELGAAAAAGDVERVRSQLDAGAAIDEPGNRGMTALHRAAAEGQDGVVALLLERRAAVNAQDARGWLPIHYAAQRGSVTIIERLVKAGADVNAPAGAGFRPLHLAAIDGRTAAVTWLLAHGADAKILNEEGVNAREYARRHGDQAVLAAFDAAASSTGAGH
jgi:hypothetical protein